MASERRDGGTKTFLDLRPASCRGTRFERDDDTEAAKLLIGVTERLLMLSEVAEASALADEEVVQARLRHVADLTDPD